MVFLQEDEPVKVKDFEGKRKSEIKRLQGMQVYVQIFRCTKPAV